MKVHLRNYEIELAYDNPSEKEVVGPLFRFLDPSRGEEYTFRKGLWDGYRNFWLNPAQKTRLPPGFAQELLVGLKKLGMVPTIVDERKTPPEPVEKLSRDMLDGIELRPYQLEAIQRIIAKKRGVVHSPPRSGKTVMQAAVCHLLGCKSILLVEKKSLLHQHYNLFKQLGIDDVGRIGDGLWESEKTHIIATFQTLHRKKKSLEVKKLLEGIDLAQCDEVHHLGSAQSYYKIFSKIKASYRIGYSGTPFRVSKDSKDFNHADYMLSGVTGGILYQITSKELRDKGYLVEPTINIVKVDKPGIWYLKDWRSVYKEGIVQNSLRNSYIVNTAKYLAEQGETVLIIIKELAHGRSLLEDLWEKGVETLMSSGGDKITYMSPSGNFQTKFGTTKDVNTELENSSVQVVIGTSVYDEGVDLPSLTSVIIGAGGKSNIKTIQRAFRAMTSSTNKSKAYVFDFYDNIHNFLRNQSTKRIDDYREEEIKVVRNLGVELRKAIGVPF